jgi:hypothetical protein
MSIEKKRCGRVANDPISPKIIRPSATSYRGYGRSDFFYGQLSHAKFFGLRANKDPRQVVRERHAENQI